MGVPCMTRQHAVAPGEVRNQGFGFGRCRHCGQDMIRSNRKWRPVPKGFRVVWRRNLPQQAEINADQLLLDLRTVGRDLIVPAGAQRWRLAEVLFLLLAALQYLAWAVVERLRAWQRVLRLPYPVAPPLEQLPFYGQGHSRISAP